MRPFFRVTLAVCLLAVALSAAGCRRSQDAFDDRTLEKRSHVETVRPEDKKDAFRP